jgi:hypothetical protein
MQLYKKLIGCLCAICCLSTNIYQSFVFFIYHSVDFQMRCFSYEGCQQRGLFFYVSSGAGMVDEVLSIPSHPDNFNSNPNLAAVVNHCDDTDGDFTVVPLAA